MIHRPPVLPVIIQLFLDPLHNDSHDEVEHIIENPAATNGIIFVWDAARAFAIVNISATIRVNDRDVSFTSVITSFVIDGKMRLIT